MELLSCSLGEFPDVGYCSLPWWFAGRLLVFVEPPDVFLAVPYGAYVL